MKLYGSVNTALIVFLLTAFVASAHAQDADCAYNSIKIDTANVDAVFEGRQAIFDSVDIVLSSENHALSACKTLSFETFRYLNAQHDYRNLLLEFPHSYAYCIDKFFETGDSSSIMYHGKLAIIYPEFIFKLYELYKTLPKNKKFKIWGIDFDGRHLSYSRALKSILAHITYDTSLKKLVNESDFNINNNSEELTEKLYKLLTEDSSFIKQLRNNESYTDLKLILTAATKQNLMNKRNREIAMQIADVKSGGLPNTHSEVKIYGQFGIAHTVRESKSLTSVLESPKYADKIGRVFTIGALFYDCFTDDADIKRVEIKNNYISNGEYYRCVNRKRLKRGVLLIPDTRPVNSFDITYCYVGFE